MNLNSDGTFWPKWPKNKLLQIIVSGNLYKEIFCLEKIISFLCVFVFQRVSLQCSSDEFKEVEALFCKTMIGFDIVKIERIQNKGLWEVFQW